MQIHQFNLQYVPEEDRILFRLNTVGGEEFRFYFTRRFVSLLEPILVRMLEDDYKRKDSVRPFAAKAALEFEHKKALSTAVFDKKYSENASSFPLGKLPILLTTIKVKQAPGGSLLCLYPSKGEGIEVKVDGKILHALYELLKDRNTKAQWNLEFSMQRDVTPIADSPPAKVLH